MPTAARSGSREVVTQPAGSVHENPDYLGLQRRISLPPLEAAAAPPDPGARFARDSGCEPY